MTHFSEEEYLKQLRVTDQETILLYDLLEEKKRKINMHVLDMYFIRAKQCKFLVK